MSKAKTFNRGSQFAMKPGTQPQVAKTDLVMAIGELSKKLEDLDISSSYTRQAARTADWRSIALMRVISEKLNITTEELTKKIEEVQIEAYNADSSNDDLNRGLVSADSDIASDGFTAIVQVKTFLNNEEVLSGGALRSKITIGKNQLAKEVDEALLGMKVGESKKFPLSLQGATDTAEVILFGLRKQKVVIQDSMSQ